MGRMFRLLKADEIEVKVKQVREKGAVALIYKTSRVDMDILDEKLGALNWTTEYDEIKGNLYCGIGIRQDPTEPFVWKWDCGIESRTDEDGNEKKGEASDAFKRAGFKVGIGRELYSAPFIFLNVETILDGKKYKLKNPFDSFSVSKIEYDENDKISVLEIVNGNGERVYSYPKRSNMQKQITEESQTSHTTPKTAPKSNNNVMVGGRLTMDELITVWGVKNPQETLGWLERKIGYYLKDWDDDQTATARSFLQAEKNKRIAEKERFREYLRHASGDLPYPEVE